MGRHSGANANTGTSGFRNSDSRVSTVGVAPLRYRAQRELRHAVVRREPELRKVDAIAVGNGGAHTGTRVNTFDHASVLPARPVLGNMPVGRTLSGHIA